MKAMILAAGKGTRVQPITHVIPKPMIPILQKPVMEFLLELLKEHGFTEVMVNVSTSLKRLKITSAMASVSGLRLRTALKDGLKKAN